MSITSFTLIKTPGARTVPNEGECLSDDLYGTAQDLLTKADEQMSIDTPYAATLKLRAAALLWLAADALDVAAGVTIGHSRADRYKLRAGRYRHHAETLEAANRE